MPCQVWKDADTCVGSAGCWIGLHEVRKELIHYVKRLLKFSNLFSIER
jgi:hypothetical protein